jgi:predicted ribosome quality control (RQC) complex YloA/Tae2 family protein
MPALPASTFDSVVLAAVAQEIARRLPLRILRAGPGASWEILLHTDRGVLLFSADPSWARVHFTRLRPVLPHPQPLADLLRARLVGGRIVRVRQPAFERVLELEVEAADGLWQLVAEPMGKHANLVLVRDGTVAGVARPVAPHHSRVRPLLPGFPYRPPPRDPRPAPGEWDAVALEACLRSREEPLWRALLRCVAGIGPLLSYEVAWRTGDPEAPCEPGRGAKLALELAHLRDDLAQGRFDPRVYGPPGEAAFFTPFPYRCLQTLQSTPVSMSEAVEQVLDARARAAHLKAQRTALLRRIEALLARKTSALQQVRRDLEEAHQLDRLRESGELLLAYAHQVPRGAHSVQLPGYGGQPVEIPLDPSRSAVENAQEFFRRYAKLRATLRALPARAEALEREVEALHALRVHAEDASTPQELEAVQADLLAPPGRKRPRPALPAPRTFTVDGFQVVVGRSNRDNDRVTFRIATPRDLWFHARGLPGAHVVLRTGGRTPSEETVRRVAALAAYYSAGRQAGAVEVDVTERRHVRKPPGSPTGWVTYQRARTLRVAPQPPEGLEATSSQEGAAAEEAGPGTL